jgi:predicted nucleic acid-binding protein
MKICMSLDVIADGTRVTLDANVLIYHFLGSSEQCRRLLSRCQSGSVTGSCPCHVALEVLHRLTMLEASIVSGNPARGLSQNPERIRSLRHAFSCLSSMEQFGLQLLPLTPAAALRAPWFCLHHGLMANDAALLACMEEQAIGALATADQQLRDVPPVKTYLVTDLVGE